MTTSSDSSSPSEEIGTIPTASTETILQFPTAVIDYRLGDLVQHELTESMKLSDNRTIDEGLPLADNITTRSESPSDLDESGYEMVDTDVDSRDDAATESVASTDCGRSDDVASLADTEEQTDDEEASVDGDRDTHEGIPAYDGLDEPSETPTLHHSTNSFLDEVEKPITRSIEFEEPENFGAENVSVKHTIADFSEERSAQIILDMKLKTDQKHLMATIHQTMTKQGLSTKEPLRILYIGSHSAKQDIIHKIASSVTASINGDSSIRKHSQVYNVVPVSAFGSNETPEIELMHSSGYQIQVEDCISVTQLRDAAFTGSPSAITIHTEGGGLYTSWPKKSGPGYEINPQGCVRPQIALIYCSDTDTDLQRRDTALARTFMSRHSIPSIVISHRQSFNKSVPPMVLDPHAIHMCLESRDNRGSGHIIHQRLPIDLTSFLNLDARQMNRNLAYLTGLHEKARPAVSIESRPKLPQRKSWTYTEKPRSIRVGILEKLRTVMSPRSLVPVVGLLIFLGLYSTTNLSAYMRSHSVPSVSVNGSSGSQMVHIATSSDVSSASSSSAFTQTAVSTKTKTITVVESRPPGPNSLIPFVDFKKLTETVHNLASPAVNKSATCSAEVVDGHKILMRIPSDIKLNWITRGDMFINLTRGGQSILVENAYSSPEGLILELPKEEAYGLFNVSVTTTKKPKINSTFHVDFGYNVQNIFDKLAYMFRSDILEAERTLRETLSSVNNQTQTLSSTIFTHWQKFQEAASQAANQSTSTTNYLTSLAKAASLDLAKHSAILTRDVSHRFSETQKSLANAPQLQKARSALDEAIFRAQVGSKLYWLRLQGREQEFHDYKSKAAAAQKKLRSERERKSKSNRKARTTERKARIAERKARKEARKERKGKA